jgi:hypothetical protein
MVDAIIDDLQDDDEGLKACSTVCKAWTAPARRNLFESVSIHSENIAHFLIYGGAIAPFVRHLELDHFQTRGLNGMINFCCSPKSLSIAYGP